MGQVLGTILARSCTLLRKLTDFQSLLVFWCFRLTLEFAGEFFTQHFFALQYRGHSGSETQPDQLGH